MRDSERKSRRFAKNLRRRMTQAEVILWSRLKTHSLRGFKFRRQHPIGPFIADFVCVECMLVLEVDGDTHALPEQMAHDARRRAYLHAQGWRELRVTNTDIYANLTGVLDMIAHVTETSARPLRRSAPPPP